MDEKMTGQYWFDTLLGFVILILGWISNKQYDRITDLEKDMAANRDQVRNSLSALTERFTDKLDEARRERMEQTEALRTELKEDIMEHARVSAANFGVVNGKLDALMVAMVKKNGE